MTSLTPHIPTGGRWLDFDLPGLRVGVAEYDEGPTGCTVFAFDNGAVFAADVRGGSVGTVGADYGFARAVCFAGGSLLGLEAAAGVAAAIFEDRGHEHVDWNDVPLVAGAIIFDFAGRRTGVYPDKALGAAAYRAAVTGRFPLGQRGAGRGARVGKLLSQGAESESAGQGGAFAQSRGAKVAVFSVVNALGVLLDRQGRVVRGNRDPVSGERLLPAGEPDGAQAPSGNTTLTMVVTDQRLSGGALTQLARQVHASMARAVQPFHTVNDGDVLFAASTRAAEGAPPPDVTRLGMVASELAWDAVLACWDPED
jgi:L-aminopeptidase/D-esterase-like protein